MSSPDCARFAQLSEQSFNRFCSIVSSRFNCGAGTRPFIAFVTLYMLFLHSKSPLGAAAVVSPYCRNGYARLGDLAYPSTRSKGTAVADPHPEREPRHRCDPPRTPLIATTSLVLPTHPGTCLGGGAQRLLQPCAAASPCPVSGLRPTD